MSLELTDNEWTWARRWERLIQKAPAPLQLFIDCESSCGDVEVVCPEGSALTRSHRIWIGRLKAHLERFPAEDAWLLPNIDGWHVGKGRPRVESGTTFGPGGAMASHWDNYEQHYLYSVPVDYGPVPSDMKIIERLESSRGEINAEFIST